MDNPLVFIHGAGDNARIWRLQMDYFGPGQAFAIDLPGHGQRPDTLPAEASVQDYAQAAHEIVQHELQLRRPVIVGHSMGGAIAMVMAMEYGAELAGLVLIGTGARIRVYPALLEAAQKTPEQARLQLVSMGVAQANVGTLPQVLLKEIPAPEPGVLYRDLTACNTFDLMAKVSEITLPTLIICGDDDRSVPGKYSEYLHNQIAGSALRIIQYAGHYVMREQREAVNLAIEEWLHLH